MASKMGEIQRSQTCGYVCKDTPGRYKMRREIKVGKASFIQEIECNNPAWAIKRFDEWEQSLTLAEQPKQAVAA